MKRYDNIQKKMKLPNDASFKNSLIVDIGIEWNTHFNILYPKVNVKRDSYDAQLFGSYNLTGKSGEILRHIYECVKGDYRGDIIDFKILTDTPIRLIVNKDKRIIGIAHFMKENYIVFEDYFDILKGL